jgi:hypothetical protein
MMIIIMVVVVVLEEIKDLEHDLSDKTQNMTVQKKINTDQDPSPNDNDNTEVPTVEKK